MWESNMGCSVPKEGDPKPLILSSAPERETARNNYLMPTVTQSRAKASKKFEYIIRMPPNGIRNTRLSLLHAWLTLTKQRTVSILRPALALAQCCTTSIPRTRASTGDRGPKQ